MRSYLIPLGTRCNSAILTSRIVNQARFPFDWVQMNVESMRDVVHLESDQVKEFWTTYFSEIDSAKYNTKTGSWFPHDSFSSEEEKKETIEKYVRRTERLHSVLDSNQHVTYLIVFGFPQEENIEKVLELTFAVRNRQRGPVSFIICNAMIQEATKEDIVFMYEKLEGGKGYEDWENLATRLEARIRQHLEKEGIEAVAF
jgi:hypothetical protein